MEDERIDIPEEEQSEEGYKPRPAWQVWGARVSLVLFIAVLIAFYINLARGGM